ncbi:serine kinase [Aliiroseovarius crassostreae]|uniref:HPr kinase/phosphorylase n=1 Tax=Aliiroseovarius crassostreae TaxID=154981 RepID=UPI0022039035|nr:serine kinase [Aliiroseovarius crassostreae]UWP92474.1 serine kinase [Aliiroseovarius crassostreae]
MSEAATHGALTGAVLTPDARGYVPATTVAIDGRGVMLIGPSGSGKSALALQLISLGAMLVSDDLTRVAATPTGLTAHAPDHMAGKMEARGVGLIRVPHANSAPLAWVVDLSQTEDQRLPPSRPVTIVAKYPLATLWRVDAPHFPSALFYMVKLGVHNEEDG